MADTETGYAAVVADGHLNGESGALDQFLAFIGHFSKTNIRELYILGDLFTVWLGAPRLQLSHHHIVIDALQTLTDQGVRVTYVEGNRDYFLFRYSARRPFVEVAPEFSETTIGGRRLYLAHGDLVNIHDRQYRQWRRFSRNRAIYSLFMGLPSFAAIRLAQYLEQRFRATNQQHKTVFPTATCQDFARTLFTHYDTVILGHFHCRYHNAVEGGGRLKSLYVLPAWKDEPAYLEISLQGQCELKSFRPSTGECL